MSFCACSPDQLTTVTFDQGIVLLRCGLHDLQCWVVDGQQQERTDVLENLRAIFLERREQRRRSATPAAEDRVIQLPSAPSTRCAPLAAVPESDADKLNALLQARGLTGAWSIA